MTRQKQWELSWTVLMHLPYNLELTPNDLCLFLSMAIDFAGEEFVSRETCEYRLSQIRSQ